MIQVFSSILLQKKTPHIVYFFEKKGICHHQLRHQMSQLEYILGLLFFYFNQHLFFYSFYIAENNQFLMKLDLQMRKHTILLIITQQFAAKITKDIVAHLFKSVVLTGKQEGRIYYSIDQNCLLLFKFCESFTQHLCQISHLFNSIIKEKSQ